MNVNTNLGYYKWFNVITWHPNRSRTLLPALGQDLIYWWRHMMEFTRSVPLLSHPKLPS